MESSCCSRLDEGSNPSGSTRLAEATPNRDSGMGLRRRAVAMFCILSMKCFSGQWQVPAD